MIHCSRIPANCLLSLVPDQKQKSAKPKHFLSKAHTGVKVNVRADRLTGKVTTTSALLLVRSEVLRSLRHKLRAQSQGHHAIDRLEDGGVERRSALQFSLKGREKAIINQTNTRANSKATLGKLSFKKDDMVFVADYNMKGILQHVFCC